MPYAFNREISETGTHRKKAHEIFTAKLTKFDRKT